jgi:hypothetical protein
VTRILVSLLPGFEKVLRCRFLRSTHIHSLSDDEGVGRIWFTLHFRPFFFLFFDHALVLLLEYNCHFLHFLRSVGWLEGWFETVSLSTLLEGQALREKDGFVTWTTNLFHQT